MLHELLRENLPAVHAHLEQLGIPVDVAYDKVASFFADTFHSELVLRLWDLVFLEVSSSTADGRRRTLWVLLGTAYYLFYVNQKELLLARSASEALAALENAAVLTYETDYVVREILDISEKLFATSRKILNRIVPDAQKRVERRRNEYEHRMFRL